jgi:hypothetical protein
MGIMATIYSAGDMSTPVLFASLALVLGINLYRVIRLSRPAAVLCPYEDWNTFFPKFSSIAAEMDYLPESSGNWYWEFAPLPPADQKTSSKANTAQQGKLKVELTVPNTVRISGIAVVVKEIRRKFPNTIPVKADPGLRRRARFITAGVVIVLIVLPLIVIMHG